MATIKFIPKKKNYTWDDMLCENIAKLSKTDSEAYSRGFHTGAQLLAEVSIYSIYAEIRKYYNNGEAFRAGMIMALLSSNFVKSDLLLAANNVEINTLSFVLIDEVARATGFDDIVIGRQEA